MPLPQLNTGGIDITNTLRTIDDMKTNKLRREGLMKQNAIADYELSPEVRKQKNEINMLNMEAKKLDMKAKELDNKTKIYDYMQGGLRWATDAKTYGQFRNHTIAKMGLPEDILPPVESFFDTKPSANGDMQIFNPDRLNTWKSSVQLTASEIFADKNSANKYTKKTAYGPDGQSLTVLVKNGETFDPETVGGKGWTGTAPGSDTDNMIKDLRKTQLETSIAANKEKLVTDAEKAAEKAADNKTKGAKRLAEISGKIYELSKKTKTDSGGALPYTTTNKAAGMALAKEYNTVAKSIDDPSRVVWDENAGEVIVKVEEPGKFWGTNTVDKTEKVGSYVVKSGEEEPVSEPGVVTKPIPKQDIAPKAVPETVPPVKGKKITGKANIDAILAEATRLVNEEGYDADAVVKRIEEITGVKVTFGKPKE